MGQDIGWQSIKIGILAESVGILKKNKFNLLSLLISFFFLVLLIFSQIHLDSFTKTLVYQLAMLFAALSFPMDWKKMFECSANVVFSSIMLFLFVCITTIFIFIGFSVLFQKPDNGGVANLLIKLPLFQAIGLFLLAAISEELFFRVVLNEMFGIMVSSTLFALMHMRYCSGYEILDAFAIGLIFSCYFKRTKNISAPILTHFLIDVISFVLVRVI